MPKVKYLFLVRDNLVQLTEGLVHPRKPNVSEIHPMASGSGQGYTFSGPQA